MELVEVTVDGPVALVRLCRPEAANALNAAVLAGLRRAFDDLERRPAVRAAVITGTGEKAFSAGADLRELAGLDAREAHRVLTIGQSLFRRIEQLDIPLLAAVNGVALGGGLELALATTFPVLASHAGLGLPEAGLGLMPGYGGTQRLRQRVGPTVAAHLMLTGHRLTSDRAHALGLTPVPPVDVEDLLRTTTDIAHSIAEAGPAAVRAIRLSLRLGADAPAEAALALESGLAAIATASDEAAEGIAAFLERRPAVFPERVPPDGQGS